MGTKKEKLRKQAILNEGAIELKSGALSVSTGEFTGRSPLDRFIVKDAITEDKIWWGDINIPFDSNKFDKLYDKVVNYLSDKEVYARDCYACADDNYRLNITSQNWGRGNC